MNLIGRASRLLKANINHLLDAAEDPEVMVEELIREMDEAIAELRRETVNAVAREKELARKALATGEAAEQFESQAALALDQGNEELARKILAARVDALRSQTSLEKELARATSAASKIKVDLVRMQEQAGVARRKKDGLIRRKRAAEARLRTEESARRSIEAVSAAEGRIGAVRPGPSALEGYADAISAMEARAEATREISGADDGEIELAKLVADQEIDRELERLKQKRAAVSHG